MSSRWPVSSGASVTTRTGASAFSAESSSAVPVRAALGCAPSLPSLMKGPSRCTPSTRAPPSARPRIRRPTSARTLSSSARGAVMVVARRLVVPCRACSRAIVSTAPSPAMRSAPPPPWTCRSTKPGSTSGTPSPGAGVGSPWTVTMRPSISTEPRTHPPGVRIAPSICRVSLVVLSILPLPRPPPVKEPGPAPGPDDATRIYHSNATFQGGCSASRGMPCRVRLSTGPGRGRRIPAPGAGAGTVTGWSPHECLDYLGALVLEWYSSPIGRSG
jgi:hypothetical protein